MERTQGRDEGSKQTMESDGGVKYKGFLFYHLLLKNQKTYCWNLTLLYSFITEPARAAGWWRCYRDCGEKKTHYHCIYICIYLLQYVDMDPCAEG